MEDLRKSLPSYKSDSSLIKTSEGVGVQGRSLVESRIGAMRSDIEKESCENFALRLEAVPDVGQPIAGTGAGQIQFSWILSLEKIPQDECGRECI